VAGVAAMVEEGVAAAPQMALLVVDNQFAIVTRGALKILVEFGSLLTEDARAIIFLSGSDPPVQVDLNASNIS